MGWRGRATGGRDLFALGGSGMRWTVSRRHYSSLATPCWSQLGLAEAPTVHACDVEEQPEQVVTNRFAIKSMSPLRAYGSTESMLPAPTDRVGPSAVSSGWKSSAEDDGGRTAVGVYGLLHPRPACDPGCSASIGHPLLFPTGRSPRYLSKPDSAKSTIVCTHATARVACSRMPFGRRSVAVERKARFGRRPCLRMRLRNR